MKTIFKTQVKYIFYSIIIGGISFILLQSCYRQNSQPDPDIHDELNNYLGIWRSVEKPYPFSAELYIDSTHFFFYSGGACFSHFQSQGNWILKDDTLILNSTEPAECYSISRFGINCEIIEIKDINDNTDYNSETSIEGCIPEDSDFTFFIFENERFLIKDSILIHIPHPDNPCPDIKDNFIKEEEEECKTPDFKTSICFQ